MTKTEAIRTARRAVSIHGAHQLGRHRPLPQQRHPGPSTEWNTSSYEKARAVAASWKAEVALGLMGRLSDDARYAIERDMDDPHADHSVEALVKIGLAASPMPTTDPPHAPAHAGHRERPAPSARAPGSRRADLSRRWTWT